MSSNKQKATQRNSDTQRIVRKYVKLYKARCWNEVIKVPGKLRKQNPFNCGRPRCGLCSNARVLRGEGTMAEKRIALTFKEFLMKREDVRPDV